MLLLRRGHGVASVWLLVFHTLLLIVLSSPSADAQLQRPAEIPGGRDEHQVGVLPYEVTAEMVQREAPLVVYADLVRPVPIQVHVVDSKGTPIMEPRSLSTELTENRRIPIGTWSKSLTPGTYFVVFFESEPPDKTARFMEESVRSLGVSSTLEPLVRPDKIKPAEGDRFQIPYQAEESCRVKVQAYSATAQERTDQKDEKQTKPAWESAERSCAEGNTYHEDWDARPAKFAEGWYRLFYIARPPTQNAPVEKHYRSIRVEKTGE